MADSAERESWTQDWLHDYMIMIMIVSFSVNWATAALSCSTVSRHAVSVIHAIHVIHLFLGGGWCGATN